MTVDRNDTGFPPTQRDRARRVQSKVPRVILDRTARCWCPLPNEGAPIARRSLQNRAPIHPLTTTDSLFFFPFFFFFFLLDSPASADRPASANLLEISRSCSPQVTVRLTVRTRKIVPSWISLRQRWNSASLQRCRTAVTEFLPND